MSHFVVKLKTYDDGEPKQEKVWCLVVEQCGDPATFCTGEYFGEGQSGCEYVQKEVKRGGITCPSCLERIKMIKDIKL